MTSFQIEDRQHSLRDDLLDRAAQLGPALRSMAEDLAVTRRELAALQRENERLRRALAGSGALAAAL